MKIEIKKIEFNGKAYNRLFATKKRWFKHYYTVSFVKGNSIIKALEDLSITLCEFEKNYKYHSYSFKKPKVTDYDLQLAETIYKEK